MPEPSRLTNGCGPADKRTWPGMSEGQLICIFDAMVTMLGTIQGDQYNLSCTETNEKLAPIDYLLTNFSKNCKNRAYVFLMLMNLLDFPTCTYEGWFKVINRIHIYSNDYDFARMCGLVNL